MSSGVNIVHVSFFLHDVDSETDIVLVTITADVFMSMNDLLINQTSLSFIGLSAEIITWEGSIADSNILLNNITLKRGYIRTESNLQITVKDRGFTTTFNALISADTTPVTDVNDLLNPNPTVEETFFTKSFFVTIYVVFGLCVCSCCWCNIWMCNKMRNNKGPPEYSSLQLT
jgi:hypothetical protein